MRRSGGLRFLLVAGVAASAWSLQPANAASQCVELDPPCENTPPSVSFTPSGGTYTSATRSVTVTWGDNSGLNANSREIKLNGAVVTDSFSYSGSTVNATSQGTVTLRAGENFLTASICNTRLPPKCTTRQAIYTYEAPPAPAPYTTPNVSLAPMAQDVRRAELCAVDCFEAVVAYTTPAYVSLDAERAVTLVHRGGQGAASRVLVEVDAIDNSANVPQKMSIKVRRPNGTWVEFTNGSDEIFYRSGNGTTRLAAQFDPDTLATGSYKYEVVVRTWWSNGHTEDANPVPFRFIVVNEHSSPFGSGWTMAGLQRLHIQSDGILITEGDGSAVFFETTGTNTWAAPSGEFTTLTFDEKSSRYWRTYPDKSRAVFHSGGRLLLVWDRFSANYTTYSHSSGLLMTITDPIGRRTTFTYGSGKLTSITDPTGRQTTFVVNANGNLTRITDPDGVRAFQFTWDGSNRLKSYADRRGGVWDIMYDAHSKLATLTAPEIPVFGSNDPTRPVTRFRSREMRLLPSASNGTSSSPAPRVLPDNVQARVTDARSNHTDLTLNRFGAPTFIERPLNDTTRLDWDPQGRLRGVRQANGRNVEYDWQGAKLTRIQDTFTEAITTITYDTAFSQVEEVSVGGVTVTNTLGSYGEVLESRIGVQQATTFTYDSRYRVKTITDPEGLETENVYESGNFQNTANVELSKSGMTTRTTAFTYDAYGRVTTITDPADNVSKLQYDLLNRPTKTTDPRNFETTFNYSTNNVDLYHVTDAKGQVYTYNRNALGWVQSEVDPANRQIAYQYDANGNLMLKKNRRNQLIVFDYDALNRIWKRLADDVLTWWSYDNPLNRSMVVENDVSRDEIYYDKAGRVTNQIAIRGGRRYHLSSHYLKEGPRDTLRMIEPWSRMVAYNYDNGLRLTSLRDLAGDTTSLSYNDVGLPTSIELPPPSLLQLTQTLTYTPSEALASSSYTIGLGTLEYDRDNLDRIVTRGDPDSGPPAERSYRQLTYDENSQLTGYIDRRTTWQKVCPGPFNCHWDSTTTTVRQDSYSYDAVGNRTDKGSALQAGNRSGLYQVRARWYDPQVGRFISEDPTGLGGGINAYAYAGNDPVNKRDPSGLQECRWEYEANVSKSGASELIATRHCSEAGGGGGGRSSGWNPNPSDRGSNPPRGGPDGSEWGGVGGTSGPNRPKSAKSQGLPVPCVFAGAEFFARLAVDAGLVWLYGSGGGLVLRGAALFLEGKAISTGLILTATARTAGASGAMEMVVGRGLSSVGLRSVAGTAASMLDPLSQADLSLLPVNTVNFFRKGGFAACRR